MVFCFSLIIFISGCGSIGVWLWDKKKFREFTKLLAPETRRSTVVSSSVQVVAAEDYFVANSTDALLSTNVSLFEMVLTFADGTGADVYVFLIFCTKLKFSFFLVSHWSTIVS